MYPPSSNRSSTRVVVLAGRPVCAATSVGVMGPPERAMIPKVCKSTALIASARATCSLKRIAWPMSDANRPTTRSTDASAVADGLATSRMSPYTPPITEISHVGIIPWWKDTMPDSDLTIEHAVSADGTRIGFERRGSGPALVLVQGAMGTAYTFRELA